MNTHKEIFSVEDHYSSVANTYDSFYKATYEAVIPVLIEYLDLRPQHNVVDIGSGSGFIAESLCKLSGLENPVWCVDPSVEMQELARKRKGVYPVQKTAEEFFSDPKLSQCFDRVVAVFSVHHFADPVDVYKGIIRSLRPGGIFLQLITMKDGNPIFKNSTKVFGTYFDVVNDSQKLLREIDSADIRISEHEVTFTEAMTKSNLCDSLRRRYSSELNHLTDEQIEERVKQLEKELSEFNEHEPIIYNRLVSVTKVEKKGK